jgi:hypothetical protein
MTPPLVCPPPPSCPLYAQRLDYGADEPLRRAILAQRRTAPSLADLVRQEGAPSSSPPPALPPGPAPTPEPVFETIKKGVNHA